MRVRKNITADELKCKCGDHACNATILTYEPVLDIVQNTCDHFADILGVDKVTLRITSAARCFTYNRKIGSNGNSQHPRCRAIDFTIDGVSNQDVQAYLLTEYPDTLGIGSYETFTHVDSRPVRARWHG